MRRRLAKLDFEMDQGVIFTPYISLETYRKIHFAFQRQCEAANLHDKLGKLSLVLSSSPIEVRQALEYVAMMFRREKGFDFPLFGADEHKYENTVKDRHFVWTDTCHHRKFDHTAVVGGCSFRWREDEEDHLQPHYAMQWVWFHPHFRGAKKDCWDNMKEESLLCQAWPIFRNLYGDFRLDPPLSAAMNAFLRKMGEKCDEKFFLRSRQNETPVLPLPVSPNHEEHPDGSNPA